MIVLDALSSTASRKFFKRDVVVEIPGKNIPFRGEMSILLWTDIYIQGALYRSQRVECDETQACSIHQKRPFVVGDLDCPQDQI